MIGKSTCEKIWHCYREIEAGNKLLSEIKEIDSKNKERASLNGDEEKLRDVFGNMRDLELGIPSGESSKRLFRVSFELAIPVIKAHIANKTSTLAELQEVAKLELDNPLVSLGVLHERD